MNPKKLLERHLLPCGPMSVSVEGVCRRRLRDSMDALLDRLTQETHPEGVDVDILEMEEDVEIPEEKEPEETDKEKKERLIREGKLKADVKKEVQKYADKIMPKPKPSPKAKTSDHSEAEEEEHTEDKLQGNSRLLQRTDGKLTRWQGKG